ncbi:MAG: hypothetical protein HY884_09230 [Deltaproteobacteria bacterium]|nr:hypothetical protein [Deltaproteobacteria bacterium]
MDAPKKNPFENNASGGVKKQAPASAREQCPSPPPVSPKLNLRQKDISGGAGEGNRSQFVLLVLLILLLFAVSLYFYYPKGDTRANKPPSRAGGAATTINPAGDLPPTAQPRSMSPVISITVQGVDLGAASEAIKSGDHEKAAALLRESLKKTPGSEEIKKALAGSLNELGVKSSRAGDIAAAKGYFTEAFSYHQEPVLLQNLANAKISLKDYKGAIETLDPVSKEPYAKLLLGDIYYRLGVESYQYGKVDDARAYFEKSFDMNPVDANVRDALEQLKAEHKVESKMNQTDGSHFTVKYEGGENAVTGHVISILLEEAYFKVGTDLGLYPDDRIEAVLMMKETFWNVTGSPSWAGALYDGRIKLPAGGITEKTHLLEQVLFHEYTHAVVHRLSGGKAPVWLNEGLAQMEEGKDDGRYRDDLRGFAEKNYDKHDMALRPYERSFMGLNSNQAEQAYLFSLSATQHLMREYGAFSAGKILANLKAGKNIEQAFQESIYISYADFQRSWFDSLKR